MGRRKPGVLDAVATLPWPIGLALGVLAFLALRYGVGGYLAASASSVTRQLGQQLAGGLLAPLAWMALAVCWLGALLSYRASRKRRHLLAAQTGLDSLRAMSWREFEMLVGEAFRRRGYAVEETGLGGADGGVDLILRKDGRRELVQCKQWRNTQVTVSVVREMWGLAAHHRADGVRIVSVGEFTRDAVEFARGKPIELINGSRLVELVRGIRTATGQPDEPAAAAAAPSCPACSAEMVRRRNRTTGDTFWGCSRYPQCRGTSAIGDVL